MEINKTRRLLNQQFYSQPYKKTQIFWHHTAGTTAQGAFDWWNQTPERVGTPYLIDRDGTIYEVFDPNCWGYHLGVTLKNGGNPNDLDEKQSIGIELVAAGHLYSDGEGNMVQYPLYPKKIAKRIIPKEEVWDMGENIWRGQQFFHSYTDKQIESLIWLTKKLSVDHKIPIQEDISKMFEYNPDVIKKMLPGVWSHSTVRKDKGDVVPHPSFIEKIKKGLSDIKSIKK